MYQIMTLDGWGDLCRTLLYKRQNYVAPFFFVSYVFIASIVLANVVIAILLEHFLRNKDESEGAAGLLGGTFFGGGGSSVRLKSVCVSGVGMKARKVVWGRGVAAYPTL